MRMSEPGLGFLHGEMLQKPKIEDKPRSTECVNGTCDVFVQDRCKFLGFCVAGIVTLEGLPEEVELEVSANGSVDPLLAVLDTELKLHDPFYPRHVFGEEPGASNG